MPAAAPLPARLSRDALDRPEIPADVRRRLYAAVQVDDRVEAGVALPAAIHLDYDQAQLIQGFRLCRQLWTHDVDRRAFRRTVARIARERAVPEDERVRFKDVRAKFKHLRFAHAAFDERHRYPPLFNAITRLMGQLQDAFKNGQHGLVARRAALLWLFLDPLPFGLVRREADDFRPTTPATFRRYVEDQIATIRADLARPRITGKDFHQLRKVISRQVAQYDSLRTLHPTPYHQAISRYLSAINGLMGGLHDVLVERRARGEMDYHRAPFAIPDDIRERLAAYAARFAG